MHARQVFLVLFGTCKGSLVLLGACMHVKCSCSVGPCKGSLVLLGACVSSVPGSVGACKESLFLFDSCKRSLVCRTFADFRFAELICGPTFGI
jgi:hypothetical protein